MQSDHPAKKEINNYYSYYSDMHMLEIINTHGRFAIAFLPLTTRLSTELFEAVFIKKSSG